MQSKTNKTTHNTAKCIFSNADKKRLKKLLSKDSFDQLMRLHEGDQMPSELFDATGQEIAYWEMGAISINSWNDGREEYIYQIGERVYAHYDYHGDFFLHEKDDVTSVIEFSYSNEDEIWQERCAQFGVEPPLTPAKRGDSGLFRVWIQTHYRFVFLSYYDHPRWARDDNHEVIWFESLKEARKWISQDEKKHHDHADIQYPKGHYQYSNEECAPREYKICK